MITTLSIKNYTLIEDVHVDLSGGLTMITGETGAGKSILLGALSLLLGKRADLRSIKDSKKKTTIEAEFAIGTYSLEKIFIENDLDYEDHTIIRREILPGGKSRGFINDTPVSVQQMQALGAHLVDIHSQNETLALSSENFQLDVIDALAETRDDFLQYTDKLEEFITLSSKLLELENLKAESTKELDYNTFLYNELVEAQLSGVNLKDLEEEYETLNNAEEIKEILSQAYSAINREEIGNLDSLKEVRLQLSKLRNYKKDYDELWVRINSIILELEDIEQFVEQEASSIEADPRQLITLNEKLQAIHKLQQKHMVSSIEELKEIEKDLSTKIDVTLNLDSEIERVELKVKEAKSELNLYGLKISEARKKAIPALKNKLELFLADLGLPNAQFNFDLTPSNSFKATGMDDLEVLFSANKGIKLGPLKKVASGGEMSRIMLGVKAVLSEYKNLPTIIFDEIDTGVSGEIAIKIADIMQKMGEKMQLLSITHLPQIAAKGSHHIKVFKYDKGDRTVTYLKILNEEERIVEIAQMIGGHKITDATLANAKELLN